MKGSGVAKVQSSRTLYAGRSGSRCLTVEDLWRIPRVGEPQLSPDGSLLALAVKSYDMDANEGGARVWLVRTDDGTARPLTSAEGDASQPAWSPDGRLVAFVRKRGENKQLWTIAVDGGEAEPRTDLPLGAADPHWLPDGSGVVVVSSLLNGHLTVEQTRAELERRDAEGVRVHVTEDRVYRFWDHWLTTGEVQHLFLYRPSDDSISDVTPRSTLWIGLMERSGHFDVSPDGRTIAFCGTFVDGDQELVRSAVYTVAVDGGDPVSVTGDVAPRASRPRFDGRDGTIVYGVTHDLFFYADRTRLHRFDPRTGEHTDLLTEWNLSPGGWEIGPQGRVFFDAEIDGHTSLFELVEGAEPRRLTGDGSASTPCVAASGRLYFLHQSMVSPTEVYALDADGRDNEPSRLTSFASESLADVALGEVRDISFVGAGGETVQMFVVMPPAGVPTTPAPLVHVIHGGPHGITGDLFHPRWNAQLFAAPGYVVACVNFQGSTSRGQDFAKRIQGAWGERPYGDVMAATDALIELGWVDGARMAVAGGSYGGYLSSWITTQTDRFRCCVNHAGVFDLLSQYASDVTQGRAKAVGGEPWVDEGPIDRFSPVRWTKGLNTPTLVLHGEKDYRVPVTQGLECYNILKAKGVPARLVYFVDENHWVLSPKTSRIWYREVHAWLARWLTGESVDS